MDFLAKNLRFLRKKAAATQDEMARSLDLKKSTYASYESDEGNTPPAKTLYAIAKRFDVSMDSLFEVNYAALQQHEMLKIADREVYFPVSVDLDGTELIDVVPGDHRAQAGYLSDYSDPSYIQSLPKINWDLGIYESGTKRIFEITGDSMLPIPSQSYILGVRQSYEDLTNHQAYIIITNHDILFKRIRKEGPYLHLISDNPIYPPQKIKSDEVRQYWKALKVIMDLPASEAVTLSHLNDSLSETRDKVDQVLEALQLKNQ